MTQASGESVTVPLYSPEAFQAVAEWFRVMGFQHKYSYQFSWLGLPTIQLPDDLIRLQEVIVDQRPDVIIETGVARGGSLLFYASLMALINPSGCVIGVDRRIWPESLTAITTHPVLQAHPNLVKLVHGDAAAPETLEQIKAHITALQASVPQATVMVILDAAHDHDGMLAELTAYAPLVSPGCYLIATDGIMGDAAHAGAPRAWAEAVTSNPNTAVEAFLATHPNFTQASPVPPFNQSTGGVCLSQWPQGWLRKQPLLPTESALS